MKLRNKKTGEIKALDEIMREAYKYHNYSSLTELNEEWEDYEEPEEFWYINECGDVLKYEYDGGCSCPILEAKEIGNYFETKEEAEKVVEKLKAWKRLKDKGYYFKKWSVNKCHFEIELRVKEYDFVTKELKQDLDLLFGGDNEQN